MSFELEWALAFTVVIALVGVLVFLPKRKPLPTPKGSAEGEEPAGREPVGFAVLRPTLGNPAVYAICPDEDEVLFLRVCWYHPDMSFGSVYRPGFGARLLANGKGFLWLLAGSLGAVVAFGFAYALGMKELAGEFGTILMIVVVAAPLLLGVLVFVAPLSWLGSKAAEQEFAKETGKLARLSLKALRRAADTKPNLRANRDDLHDAEVEEAWDDPAGKVAVLRFSDAVTGRWVFDLYSQVDVQAVRELVEEPQ